MYATSKTASSIKGILVPDRVYILSFSAPQIMTFWLNEQDLLSRILIRGEAQFVILHYYPFQTLK